jgi:hypothetical protein
MKVVMMITKNVQQEECMKICREFPFINSNLIAQSSELYSAAPSS